MSAADDNQILAENTLRELTNEKYSEETRLQAAQVLYFGPPQDPDWQPPRVGFAERVRTAIVALVTR